MTPVQEALRCFFDMYIAGSPTSESGLAHINSAIPVNGKSGLYKTFVRMNPLMPVCFSTFASNLEIYFHKKGFKGLDKARVDHNAAYSALCALDRCKMLQRTF